MVWYGLQHHGTYQTHLIRWYGTDCNNIVALFKSQHQPKFMEFMTCLTSKYELCDLGELKWFLGICVVQNCTKKKLWLS